MKKNKQEEKKEVKDTAERTIRNILYILMYW
jgi:hypothetical protein